MKTILNEEWEKRKVCKQKPRKAAPKTNLKHVHERVFQELKLQENPISPDNTSSPKIFKDPREKQVSPDTSLLEISQNPVHTPKQQSDYELINKTVQTMRNEIHEFRNTLKSFLISLDAMDEV